MSSSLIVHVSDSYSTTLRYRVFDHYFCYLQINNPDMRVVILKDFAMESFPATPLLSYAIEVEKITTSKVSS